MTLPENSSLMKTKRAVRAEVMMSYSHGSLILFLTILHKYLQLELQYFSAMYFSVAFGLGFFFDMKN